MSFLTQVPLSQYESLGNELTAGDALLALGSHLCMFLSKNEDPDEPKYAVEFSDSSLYPKGTVKELFTHELYVVVNVQKYFTASAEDISKLQTLTA